MYEVEIKYALEDASGVIADLARRGVRFSEPMEQIDRYYAHPCRDFVATDEALRVRRTADGVVITWKGPRLGGDTKTRREIELPLAASLAGESAAETLGRWHGLLEALGFRGVHEVSKQRRSGVVEWQGGEVEVAIDRLAGLGDYLELEVVAEAADVSRAEARLRALASDLGCRSPEPRSYLAMVLAGGRRG